MQKGDAAIVVEQSFNVPADILWKAITDVNQMRQWFFDNIPDFRPEAGFKTQFLIENEGREFLHKWEITEVVPGRLITYSWRYQQYPGHGAVTFEISGKGDVSTLKLTNVVLESFPSDIPEFTTESCRGGWEYFIQNRLKEFLESSSE